MTTSLPTTTASLVTNGGGAASSGHLFARSWRTPRSSDLHFISKGSLSYRKRSTSAKAQLHVAVDGSSNSGIPPEPELPSPPTATEESISEFISQVSDLVKLVDSRDIVELQLKQLDCEIVIRKKDALPQPQTLAPPAIMMHPSPTSPPPVFIPQPAEAPLLPTTAPAPPPPSKSSHPPFKCPMPGTFYRSPAPGAPPFVKVGDRVQKGQVVCIIEAMKLMNEIEADRAGTIVEIIAEDGKPVSMDAPLLVIEP